MPRKSKSKEVPAKDKESRFFSNSQKSSLFLYSNGKCSNCGIPLEPGWHADHITPYSRQGKTDVINGQSLCPSCNLKKGAKMPLVLREWQKELEIEYLRTNQKDFLLTALPGAGKTIAALNIGKLLLDREIINGIVVVVPTENLKEQWKDDAHKFFGIEFLPNFITKHGVYPAGFDGLCVTYQQISSGSNIFRRLCADKNLFAIFDEIHHCGEDPKRAWGPGLKNAFEYAHKRLSLSGTPFRSDNAQIPFVRYIDCICHSDFSFDYPRAIHEEVIRVVVFNHFAGEMSWLKGGEAKTASFSDELSKQESKDRLNAALNINGGWLSSLIKNADEKLNELREEDKTAGGLIIAKGIFEASAIAEAMSAGMLCGAKPIVVTSDDENASNKIKELRKSKDKWIVAVNMISEGVDIKRLRVLVYATNVSTELYFRQAVGRIVRYQKNDDVLAYCFLPSDPILLEYSKKITELQLHAIESEEEEKIPGGGDPPGPPREFNPMTVLYSSEATLDIVNIEGQGYGNEVIDKITPFAQRYGYDPAATLKMLSEMGHGLLSSLLQDKQPISTNMCSDGIPMADIVEKLKNKAHKLAYKLSCIRSIHAKDVNKQWVQMGGKYHSANDQEDLQRKISWLEGEIDKSRNK